MKRSIYLVMIHNLSPGRKSFFLMLALLILPGYTDLSASSTYKIYAYHSYANPEHKKMNLIGQVTSSSKLMDNTRQRLLNYDTRTMIITARLYDAEAVRLGDTVYLIDKAPDHRKYKNGYIIGQGEIVSIFQTEFQGWMLKAKGNFSMIQKGHFIAIEMPVGARHEAELAFRQAERDLEFSDVPSAIHNLKISLEKDPKRPETSYQLARLLKKQGRSTEAREYLLKSWSNLNRFKEVNDVLELPGTYLSWEMEYIANTVSTEQMKLKKYLHLLDESRLFLKRLRWFKSQLPSSILSMIETKGMPTVEFQYHQAELLSSIYDLLKKNSYRTVLSWLNKKERNILYEPLEMPYSRDKKASPKKAWDQAFFQAALYHYQLAHDLNKLNTKAAYRIVMLVHEAYLKNPPRAKREAYEELMKHFGRAVLSVPDASIPMNQVRNVLNSLPQS